MIFRIRFSVAGGHVHCRLFASRAGHLTFAKCGEFVVTRGPEFIALMDAFSKAQFVEDDELSDIARASRESDEMPA